MTRPRDVPPELLVRPFLQSTARAMGVSVDTLRGPLFRAPFHGVRVAAALPDTVQLRTAAALLALPAGAVAACHSAAALRGLPVPPCALVHADVPSGNGLPRVAGIRSHVRTVPAVLVRGVPTCTPAAMFLELAEYLSLVDLVVLGDAVVRHGWMPLTGLRDATASAGRRRGVVLARRAVGLVRSRVDSPMETKVRLLAVLAGLPCPVTGYRVIVDGHVVGWVDMAYPAYRIAIEYDGDLHRTLKRKWRMDVATRDTLRDLGWTVIVLTWEDYAVRPAETVGRLARELARRSCHDVPLDWRHGRVDPSGLGVEWRQAFPGSMRPAWEWDDVPAGH